MEIAIISGKGGTGKSSISAAFASLSGRTVLADCDVDAANLHIIFQPSHDEEMVFTGGRHAVIDHLHCNQCEMCIGYCRFDAIKKDESGKIAIDEISCDGCQLCCRICPKNAITMVENNQSRMFTGSFRFGHMAYGSLAPGEENSGKLVNLVREKARTLAIKHQLKAIIIDGPPGIGCAVISSITGANQVIIVTEPTVSGLHDLKRTLELLPGFKQKVWVIINKHDIYPEMTQQIETYCNRCGIAVAGKLAFDPVVVEAMVNCQTITEWAPASMISKEIARIWNTINTTDVMPVTDF
jgi:MinD superfamily P-loop ATPase